VISETCTFSLRACLCSSRVPDLPMLTEHMFMLFLQHFLTKDGQWGVQDKGRWDAFLDWLSEKKLLTSKVQSRKAVKGVTASLDDLRQGNAGEILLRESMSSESLFSNSFLP